MRERNSLKNFVVLLFVYFIIIQGTNEPLADVNWSPRNYSSVKSKSLFPLHPMRTKLSCLRISVGGRMLFHTTTVVEDSSLNKSLNEGKIGERKMKSEWIQKPVMFFSFSFVLTTDQYLKWGSCARSRKWFVQIFGKWIFCLFVQPLYSSPISLSLALSLSLSCILHARKINCKGMSVP